MTNNPTIDGVSRELLERSAYRLSDLKQSDLSEAIFTILSNPFKCSFCDDKKSVCVDWDAGEWMSCPRCSSQSDAPAVERQEPYGFASVLIDNFRFAIENGKQPTFSKGDLLWLIEQLSKAQSESAALQSTIAQLQARIAELESGRGEPVAWQYRVSAGPATGWSLWHDGKGDEFRNSYQVENRRLYTAPPAPVAAPADLLQRIAYALSQVGKADHLVDYDAVISAREDLRACLDATAALNGPDK